MHETKDIKILTTMLLSRIKLHATVMQWTVI